MQKRREINSIRTDYLETWIAHYWAIGDYDACEVLEKIARDIRAPIDEQKIEKDKKLREEFYKKTGSGG